MSPKLRELIEFRADRLFDGAVNLDWFFSDRIKARQVAASFVFHGPKYHGVRQEDIASESFEHRLVDTATFAYQVIRHSSGSDDQPFTLAIAGYGTGKSHLATTLAMLLSDPSSDVAKKVLSNLEQADANIAEKTRAELSGLGGKSIVLAINGMGNFDLAAEVARQVLSQLKDNQVDTAPIDQLRPRFTTAIKLLNLLSAEDCEKLIRLCGTPSKENLIEELTLHNEALYDIVHDYFLNQQGLPIRSVGDETVKDVLDKVAQEYCGEGKPFKRIVLLFDEFGRFAEFATTKSQIAGSGVLQHLFEGIQANSSKITFVGFIQFDLNTYVQRIAREYRNEILRVSTRFQSAQKVYLSINLETIVANLIEKKEARNLDEHFKLPITINNTHELIQKFYSFLPQAKKKGLWGNEELFHQVIRKGCWPLSPYAIWFLYHLAAGGKHLQQRSAISLLSESISRLYDLEIKDYFWKMSATDLWSNSLETELIEAEKNTGTLGTVTQSYATVIEKHGVRLSNSEIVALRAIVLVSKMSIKSQSRQDAIDALAELSLHEELQISRTVKALEDDWNVISWDPSGNQFEILGESIPKAKFLDFLKQRVGELYTEEAKADLFVRYSDLFESSFLSDIMCSFGEKNEIQTTEWRFERIVTNSQQVEQRIKFAINRQATICEVNEARGSVIYCYVEPDRDYEKIKVQVRQHIVAELEKLGQPYFPILVVFIQDGEGLLGQSIAELTVLDEQLTDHDKENFGNLIGAHRQKCIDLISERLKDTLKRRQFVTSFSDSFETKRLSQIGDEIFSRIFSKILPFPFDGFGTARGNAADSCMRFTQELLAGKLDYQSLINKPIKEKNRGLRVLSDSWDVFTKAGNISRHPGNLVAREIVRQWDEMADSSDNPFSIAHALELACSPPYGANLASAGLLFGVYLCARRQDFQIVVDGKLENLQEGIDSTLFKGRYLDINKLRRVFVAKRDKKSESQWEALLDEWERSIDASYIDQEHFLQKALELKKVVPLPESQVYRFENFKEKAARATGKIIGLNRQYNNIIEQILWGRENNKLHKEIWGGAKLRRLQKEIEGDPLWPKEYAEAYDDEIEKVRQRAIQNFDEYLRNQIPVGRTTTAVMDFEKKMRNIGHDLGLLGLDNLNEKLNSHIVSIRKHIDDSAESHELISSIENWMSENAESKIIRVIQLKSLRESAENYCKRIEELSKRVDIPDLYKSKQKILDYIDRLQKRESELRKPAEEIWDTELDPLNIDDLILRVRSLKLVFEGCETDLDDFHKMERALVFYQDTAKQLSSDELNANDYSKKGNELFKEAMALLEEEEIPWVPDEAMKILISFFENQRNQKAQSWLDMKKEEITDLANLDVSELNKLYDSLSSPPKFITITSYKEVESLKEEVENKLNQIKVDWLYEKYQDLSEKAKQEFKLRISSR